MFEFICHSNTWRLMQVWARKFLSIFLTSRCRLTSSLPRFGVILDRGNLKKFHQVFGLKVAKQWITCSVWDMWKKCLLSFWSMNYSRMNPLSLNNTGFLFRSTLKMLTGRVWEWLAFPHSKYFSLGMINTPLSFCWDHPGLINLYRKFWFKMNDFPSTKAIFG